MVNCHGIHLVAIIITSIALQYLFCVGSLFKVSSCLEVSIREF